MTVLIQAKLPKPIAEQRFLLCDRTPEQYHHLLAALGEERSVRLTYDRGKIELVMPLELHEFSRELIGLFIRILVAELGLKLKSLGSTRLDRPDLDRAAEPDLAYYIQNQPKVAGKTINLNTDPPPDLVVEIDITHTDIDKLNLYASLGIPEFWRYNGQEWKIYALQTDRTYQELSQSPTFPTIEKAQLYQFLAASEQDEIAAEAQLRQQLRSSVISDRQ